MEPADEGFAVYRLYDSGGALLYVGQSTTVFVRLEQHVKTQPWWAQVGHAQRRTTPAALAPIRARGTFRRSA